MVVYNVIKISSDGSLHCHQKSSGAATREEMSSAIHTYSQHELPRSVTDGNWKGSLYTKIEKVPTNSSLMEAKRITEDDCNVVIRQYSLYIHEVVAKSMTEYKFFRVAECSVDFLFYVDKISNRNYDQL